MVDNHKDGTEAHPEQVLDFDEGPDDGDPRIEPDTIRHLADAADALMAAARVTRQGLVMEQCQGALRKTQEALRGACGGGA